MSHVRTTNKLVLTAAVCAGTRCLGSALSFNNSISYGARRTLSRTCNGKSSWSYIHGPGRPSPVGSALKTDQYLVLSHRPSGILLELFYGSTGVVMFQDGVPSDSDVQVSTVSKHDSFSIESRPFLHNYVASDTVLSQTRSRNPKWIGWDGSIKSGLDGRTDFSAWLAPSLVARAQG
jgi:hypothetical protein